MVPQTVLGPQRDSHHFRARQAGRSDAGTYASPNRPLIDLVHAAGAAGDMPELPDLVALIRILLEAHEETAGWAAVELSDQLDIADRQDVNLAPDSTLFTEMMDWIRRVLAEPGLGEDLVEALRDPTVLGLPEATVKLMRHRKERITERDFEDGAVFVEAVDRSRLDVPGNQSLAQRLFHLIYDSHGAHYEPELLGVPVGFIFEIDDLAEFYLLSIIGETEVPGLVATLTGLPRRPEPLDLARFINEDQAFGNPQGLAGIDVKDNDRPALRAPPPRRCCGGPPAR